MATVTIYSVKEYQQAFLPGDAPRTVWRKAVNGYLPSRHFVRKVGNSVIIAVGNVDFVHP